MAEEPQKREQSSIFFRSPHDIVVDPWVVSLRERRESVRDKIAKEKANTMREFVQKNFALIEFIREKLEKAADQDCNKVVITYEDCRWSEVVVSRQSWQSVCEILQQYFGKIGGITAKKSEHVLVSAGYGGYLNNLVLTF